MVPPGGLFFLIFYINFVFVSVPFHQSHLSFSATCEALLTASEAVPAASVASEALSAASDTLSVSILP